MYQVSTQKLSIFFSSKLYLNWQISQITGRNSEVMQLCYLVTDILASLEANSCCQFRDVSGRCQARDVSSWLHPLLGKDDASHESPHIDEKSEVEN